MNINKSALKILKKKCKIKNTFKCITKKQKLEENHNQNFGKKKKKNKAKTEENCIIKKTKIRKIFFQPKIGNNFTKKI